MNNNMYNQEEFNEFQEDYWYIDDLSMSEFDIQNYIDSHYVDENGEPFYHDEIEMLVMMLAYTYMLNDMAETDMFNIGNTDIVTLKIKDSNIFNNTMAYVLDVINNIAHEYKDVDKNKLLTHFNDHYSNLDEELKSSIEINIERGFKSYVLSSITTNYVKRTVKNSTIVYEDVKLEDVVRLRREQENNIFYIKTIMFPSEQLYYHIETLEEELCRQILYKKLIK